MRNLLRTAAAALAVFTAWVGPHSSACPGERDLLASFGDAAVVERLDVAFPARIVAVEPCPAASFTHRGQRHQLPAELAAHGTELRLVRVAHAGGEGTLLVRTGADLASLPAAPPR